MSLRQRTFSETRSSNPIHDVPRLLPTETFDRIFQYLSTQDLPPVCLSSAHLRAIAEPLLYRAPHASSPARVLQLINTLLCRPELLLHVRCLAVDIDGPNAIPGLGNGVFPALLRRLARVLSHPNLSGLRQLIYYARGETAWALPYYFSPFDSGPPLAGLTHFKTTSSSTREMSSFLTLHTSLTHLTLHSHAMGLRLPARALPNLTHLACAAPALAHIPSRKLAHVTLLDAPFIPLLGTAYISALSEAGVGDKSDDENGEGVRSVELRLGQVVVNTTQAPLILGPFAQHVPALRRLGVVAGPSFFRQVSSCTYQPAQD
ncbi:hypothetical protein FRC10_007127 [Ceratobasidium sp. 414]|nr:hypothetical protein FRC10_007127 [Ceratobasidium sp. 414]